MGSIVAVCMLVGVVFGLRPAFLNRLPPLVHKVVAAVVIAAGLWNVLWYALRHLLEFWGMAALVSGVLLVLSGLYILQNPILQVPNQTLTQTLTQRIPEVLVKSRIPVLLALFACFLLYATTIYRL